MPQISFPVLLAQIVNWVILVALIVTAFLIGRDARMRRLSWTETVGWTVLTLVIFPVGVGLYFWLGKRRFITQGRRGHHA